MKEKEIIGAGQPAMPAHTGIHVTSGIRAGYTCPQGWWKKREGKAKMCCHWVYDPYWRQYTEECTT